MKKELQTGQYFRIFEILNDIYADELVGRWTVEDNGEFHGSTNGIDGVFLSPVKKNRYHFGIDEVRKHAKCVGRLRITKLK